MSEQRDRVARVTVYRAQPPPASGRYVNAGFGDRPADALIVDEQLSIDFEIEHTLESSPNKCTIKIGNLSKLSRDFCARKPLSCRFEAGYREDGYRAMFAGDLIRGYSEKKGTDWETVLQVADGSRAHAFARVKSTWDSGVSVLTAIKACCLSLGLEIPPEIVADPDLQDQYAGGLAMRGFARDQLDRLFAPYGIRWSMQGGKMIALRDNEVLQNQAIVVDNESWLINTPQFQVPEKPGSPQTAKFQTHLYPEMLPGRKVRLVALGSGGLIKLAKVRHSGQTQKGGDWKSDLEGPVIG